MEAVPRLPMISFRLKVSMDNLSFGESLKPYIAQFYGEDPESYNNEFHHLESLRGGAVRPTIDVEGIQILKKYYCQLHFLKSRFPLEEPQAVKIFFCWQDNYSMMNNMASDIRFELMSILYNIGALHSQLGAADQRVTPDGMKIACTHFQCAAWAFQVVRENYYRMVSYISTIEIVHFMEYVCLAQAQECILEKSMMDNRKASIIAKVAVQVVDYYKKAQTMLQGGVDENNVSDYVQAVIFKEWVKYLNFKVAYHKCITLLYQGQQAEEQQKMGERVAFYQAAVEQLEVARKLSLGLEKKQDITEALAFTSDFVEGKKKAAKNENDFIYHEEIPNKDTFPEVKGASLVKGIPFSITDVEVSGPDLFAKLIPMEAHEASSLYSERKAKLLRQYGELIESKDQKLAEFMSSLQIEFLNDMRQATGIPQEIVDRAAALSAKPNAIQDLISSMTKLSNSFHEVESLLNEIEDMLKEESQSEKEYQKSIGERPPSIIATDLSREAAKYREAHNKANESNQNLHRAMVTHVGNLKTLSQPLTQLQQNMPSVKMPDPNIDEPSLKEVEMLLGKVEEMRTQRAVLWAQLRDALHTDDITRVLVTREAGQNVDDIFTKELEKHQQLTTLIEQNTAAQDNIIKAFIDAYARFSNTRRYLQGIITKRHSTLNSLITSYDSYEDLFSKASKGIEFYTKLETNVTKLLQRVKSSCKVQQEEREQMLSKIAPPVVKPEINPPVESNAPKLKDYLDSMKKRATPKPTTAQMYPGSNFVGNVANTNEGKVWPPGIRPTPLGSEINDVGTAVYDSNARSTVGSYYLQDKTSQFEKIDQSRGMQQYIQSMGVPNQYVGGAYQVPPTSVFSTGGDLNQMQDKNPQFGKMDPNQQIGQQQFAAPVGGSQQYMGGAYQVQPTQNLPAGSDVDQMLEKRLKALTVNNKNDSSSLAQQQYNTQGYGYYNTLNKTEMQPQVGYTQVDHGSYANLTNSNYTVGALNQEASTKVMQYPPSASYGQMADSNLTQPSLNSSANTNFTPYDQSSSIAPQSYLNQYSSYIPTHYQQVNQDATGLQYGQTPSNHFYASGYATAQNFQSSNLATVQSNGYYGNEVTSQSDSSGTYSASYGTAQTYPTGMQPNAYYPEQNLAYPTNYNYQQNLSSSEQSVASFNQYQGGQHNLSSSEQSDASFNQSQYSEGYVGAGSLLVPNQYNPSYMYTQAGMNYSYNPNNSSSSTGGLTTAQPLQNENASAYSNVANPVESKNVAPLPKSDSSTLDLLSGLDFSISQVPLEPELKKIDPVVKEVSKPENNTTKSIVETVPDAKVEKIDNSQAVDSTPIKNVVPSKPLDDEDVKRLFLSEVDKYEKFVDVLNNKTLNGPTNLDLKWKEIQDSQEGDGLRKNISVARCYPMKNRFPDILPYDHSRILLRSTTDDYINASYIKDISVFVPPVIITQTPLQSTMFDFWTMILEQHVDFVMCLLGDNEMQGEIYWPQEKGKDIHMGNMVISLQSVEVQPHWTKRLISVNIPEKKQFATIVHLQFSDWPENIIPASSAPLISFLKEFIGLYQQQELRSNPMVIHCSSGIGRSGVASLLLFAILEATNSPTLPDLTSLANKITSFRKNILRDREHLKFAYVTFLAYMKQTITNNANLSNASIITEGEKSSDNTTKSDPLSSLDPFWASKRDKK